MLIRLQVILVKFVTAALFVLPALFFFIVYFLQVVSSEDISQGAGLPVSIIPDALHAFMWSARFGDMYAWSVINFFDYRYVFGIDTIFRLFDVAMAVSIFVLMTTYIIGRRPKWAIKDGIVFASSFLLVFLSQYSRAIVSSFSQIHNYLFIVLFSLLFSLPFVWWLQGRAVSSRLRMKILMLVIGFFFTFSSNVTPLAFLLTLVLVTLYVVLVQRQKIDVKKLLLSWLPFAFIGVLIGLSIMYGVGSGVSSYTHGYNGSYVSIHELISSPHTGLSALISNMAANFRLVAPEFIAMALVVLSEVIIDRKKLTTRIQAASNGIRFSVVFFVFFIIHVLGVSQINVTSTTRILLPAYVCVAICLLFTMNRIVQILEIRKRTLLVIAILIVLVMGIVTTDIGILMVRHDQQAAVVLNRIKDSPDSSVCVSPSDNPTAKSPLLKYHQRELFDNWMMPTTLYGKQVSWCT